MGWLVGKRKGRTQVKWAEECLHQEREGPTLPRSTQTLASLVQ